jgi:hypothetical protein
MNNRSDMPSLSRIKSYWVDKLDLESKGFDSRFEFMECDNYCFACGMDYGCKLERAHILALCDGGNNDVHNLHNLCSVCHKASEYINGLDYWAWFYRRNFFDAIVQSALTRGVNISDVLFNGVVK